MRTTLTLDDDVAAALRRRQAERGTGLKREVNELLRLALLAADRSAPTDEEPYVAPEVSVGRSLLSDPRAWKDLLDEQDDERALRSL